jgi:hypothetical protein
MTSLAQHLSTSALAGDVGARDFGRYRLLGRIAIGGMAEVWAGERREPGRGRRLAVIKRVRPEFAAEPRFAEQFLTEGRIAARLAHPNICEVFELGDVEGELYLAMEYLRGASVRQLLRRGPMTPGAAAAVVAGAAAGLAYAHRRTDDVTGAALGIVHRDVSPDNLFVTIDGAIKVLDFGIAKICDGLAAATEVGRLKGKLGYMAPEQLAGDPCDHRVDVWALGVVLWEMLTGRRLFKGPVGEVLARIRAADVPPLAQLGVPHPPLERVVRAAVARDPDARFPTVAAFAEALAAAIAPGAAVAPSALAALVRGRCGDALEAADAIFVDGAATLVRPRPTPFAPAGRAPAIPADAPASDPSIVIEVLDAAPAPAPVAPRPRAARWRALAGLPLAAALMACAGYAVAMLTRPPLPDVPARAPVSAEPPPPVVRPIAAPLRPAPIAARRSCADAPSSGCHRPAAADVR